MIRVSESGNQIQGFLVLMNRSEIEVRPPLVRFLHLGRQPVNLSVHQLSFMCTRWPAQRSTIVQ